MKKWLVLPILVLIGLFLHFTKTHIPEKVAISGVCKNVAKALPQTIFSMERLGAHFDDYRIVIYENNSSDGTQEILAAWAKKNPKVTIISETLSVGELLQEGRAQTWNGLPYRTEVIARARNTVLKKIYSSEFDEFRFVVMADMDFPKKWRLKPILDSFSISSDWDAISANGVDRKGRYYDRFALRSSKFPLGPEVLGDIWWREVQKAYMHFGKKQGLIPVASAFGGLTIYKRDSILGCYYSGTVTPSLASVAEREIQNNPELEKWGPRVKFVLNSGAVQTPVCCEHVTFHAEMILRGHDKIFINPQMTMQYSP
jgi:glycosyltransferase involved in cell wall biosynthesis